MSVFTERLGRVFGREVPGLLGLLVLTMVAFGLTSPQFLSVANFEFDRVSVARSWSAHAGDARADHRPAESTWRSSPLRTSAALLWRGSST